MPRIIYTPADVPHGAVILPPKENADGARARALLARVRPDVTFETAGNQSHHAGCFLLTAPDWIADVAGYRAAGVSEDRILVMPELELGWPLAEWSYSYWAVPLDLISRRPGGGLTMNFEKLRRVLVDTKLVHGEFHGQQLCDGYKAGALADAAAYTRVLNMLGDDASRVDYLTMLFGEPLQVWQSWCRSLYNHLEYMDYATISPGDVIINCGVLNGSEIPLFLAALDGRGKLVNIDTSGNDLVLPHTHQALSHNHAIASEVRVAAYNKEGVIRLPVWYGMAMGGMAGKSLDGFPEQDFPCKPIDMIVRELALERVDYIKMDIEGAEIAALEGAAGTIERHRPQLAISIYHQRSHFFEIPLMLQQMCPDYRFYIKHYHYTCAEAIFYAIPKERAPRPRRNTIAVMLE